MTAGNSLDRAIRAGLPPGLELDEREEELLRQACAQANAVEALDRDVAERGYIVHGKLNPCMAEARQGRTALARLLGGIELPGSRTPKQLRATRPASARWGSA